MNSKFLLLIVIFGFIALSILGTQTLSASPYRGSQSGSCVKCGFKGDCRSCVGGGDANFCQTFNCGTCQETGECPIHSGEDARSYTQPMHREPKGSMLQAITASSKKYISSSLQISNEIKVAPTINFHIGINTIKSIATKHPRFAVTLIYLNYTSLNPGFYKVHWTPMKISSSDIDAFLNMKENENYFKQYNKEMHRLNRLIQTGQLAEIVYEITIENPSPYAQIIRIQVVNKNSISSIDPPYSLLEIKTTYTNNMVGAPIKEVSTTWQAS